MLQVCSGMLQVCFMYALVFHGLTTAQKGASIIGAIAASGKQGTAKYLVLRCVRYASGMLKNALVCFDMIQVYFRYALGMLENVSGMLMHALGILQYASGMLRYALSTH